jgi:hypothetical protein
VIKEILHGSFEKMNNSVKLPVPSPYLLVLFCELEFFHLVGILLRMPQKKRTCFLLKLSITNTEVVVIESAVLK